MVRKRRTVEAFAVYRRHPLDGRGWVKLAECLTEVGAVEYMMRDESRFMADSALPEYKIRKIEGVI